MRRRLPVGLNTDQWVLTITSSNRDLFAKYSTFIKLLSYLLRASGIDFQSELNAKFEVSIFSCVCTIYIASDMSEIKKLFRHFY